MRLRPCIRPPIALVVAAHLRKIPNRFCMMLSVLFSPEFPSTVCVCRTSLSLTSREGTGGFPTYFGWELASPLPFITSKRLSALTTHTSTLSNRVHDERVLAYTEWVQTRPLSLWYPSIPALAQVDR